MMAVEFSRQHFNAVAKILRTKLEQTTQDYDTAKRVNHHPSAVVALSATGVVTDLAIEFAKYFKEGNPRFDPIKFLNACSPDVDTMPLAELWEETDE